MKFPKKIRCLFWVKYVLLNSLQILCSLCILNDKMEKQVLFSQKKPVSILGQLSLSYILCLFCAHSALIPIDWKMKCHFLLKIMCLLRVNYVFLHSLSILRSFCTKPYVEFKQKRQNFIKIMKFADMCQFWTKIAFEIQRKIGRAAQRIF